MHLTIDDRTPVTLDAFCLNNPVKAAEEIGRAQKEAAHARKTYRRRAETVKDAVRGVLRDCPETRANKDLLVRIVNSRLPRRHSPESILRRAREIQNDEGEYPPDTVTAAVRIEEEEMSKDRARETKEENDTSRVEERDDEFQSHDS